MELEDGGGSHFIASTTCVQELSCINILWNEKVKLNGSKYGIKFTFQMELQHVEGIIKLPRVERGTLCSINVSDEDDLEFIEGFVWTNRSIRLEYFVLCSLR